MNQYFTSQNRNTCMLSFYDHPQDKDIHKGLCLAIETNAELDPNMCLLFSLYDYVISRDRAWVLSVDAKKTNRTIDALKPIFLKYFREVLKIELYVKTHLFN